MIIAYYAVVTLHVIACLFLIAVVLLQQGKGQDLASAFGGTGTQTAFGPRGSANVLSRSTTVLAGVFMVSSLALSILRPQQASVLDRIPSATPSASASPAAPGASASSPGTSPTTQGATPASPAPAQPAASPAASPTPKQ